MEHSVGLGLVAVISWMFWTFFDNVSTLEWTIINLWMFENMDAVHTVFIINSVVMTLQASQVDMGHVVEMDDCSHSLTEY